MIGMARSVVPPLFALVLLLSSAALAADAAAPGDQAGNATSADSVANERTPRDEKPGRAGWTPGPGEDEVDDDDSLSADSPIKGQAPSSTAPSEAPGRE